MAANEYTYVGDAGLGAMHVDGELSREMHELDLHPGTRVRVAGHDEDRGLVLIEWADRSGNPRLTSVDSALFAVHFEGE